VKAFVNSARIFGEATSVPAGTPVLLHMAVLASGTAVPSGTVQVYDNATPIGAPIALDTSVPKGDVQADFTATLAPGSHSFRIGYSGDVHYNPVTPPGFRTPPFTVTVGPSTGIPTTVQITEASPTITVGQSETYVVTVAPSVAGGPVPTGTVTLTGSYGSSIAGPFPLTSGVATFTVPWPRFFNVGTSRLVARYSGDGTYSAGISSEILTTVAPATPAVSLTAASAIVGTGRLSELTVTVHPTMTDANITLPFGLVQFVDSLNGEPPQPLGSPHPLTQGDGSFTTFVLATTLPEGTNVITAQYLGGGRGEWGPATSTPVTLVVRRGERRETQ
jgi:Bacterial Ig-like domain (group 3)